MDANPQSQDQLDLMAFSRDIASAMLQFMDVYPDIYMACAYLASAEPSPSVEADLHEVRTAAGTLGGALTLFSRTIESSADLYGAKGVDAQFHPMPVRALVQDMAESCILISRSMDQEDLAEMPLIEPELISEKIDKPQVAAWLKANRPSDQGLSDPQLAGPAASPQPDPTYQAPPTPSYPQAQPVPPAYPQAQPAPVAPVYPPDHQHNPYPPTDPTDPPPAPPVAPDPLPAPPAEQPPAPEDPWRAGEPPQGLPGDRRR